MKQLEKKKIFLNYFILGGNDSFVSMNILSESKKIFLNTNSEGTILSETIAFFKTVDDESLIILENPKEFVEKFIERCKITLDVDPTEVLEGINFFDISLNIDIHEKLFMFGYQSDLKEEDLVEHAFQKNYAKIGDFMTLCLIMNEKIFNGILDKSSKHEISFRSGLNNMVCQKITHNKDSCEERLFKIERVEEEEKEDGEVKDFG